MVGVLPPNNPPRLAPFLGGSFNTDKGKIQKKRVIQLSGFSYKQQYAVVVICENEQAQEKIYNRLKEEGYKLKVVAV